MDGHFVPYKIFCGESLGNRTRGFVLVRSTPNPFGRFGASVQLLPPACARGCAVTPAAPARPFRINLDALVHKPQKLVVNRTDDGWAQEKGIDGDA